MNDQPKLSPTAQQLEQVALCRKEGHQCGCEEISLMDVAKTFDVLLVTEPDGAGTRRICLQPETVGSSPLDELVVRVTGVLTRHDLPPQCRPINPLHRLYLRQHVSLSGFGSPSFHTAVSQLAALSEDLARFFETGAWQGWSGGSDTIDANSRYYSPTRFAGDIQPDIPFGAMVDPQGYLEHGKDGRFIHTCNNVVEYYEYSGRRYTPMNPRLFRDGDIVEAHLAFMAVKSSTTHGNRGLKGAYVPSYRLLVVLRGITLIERSQAMKPELKRVPILGQRRKLHEHEEFEEDDMEVEVTSGAKRLNLDV